MTEASAATNTTLKPAYRPRDQFLPFHSRTQRYAVLVCHRRSGKTVAAVNELIEQALWFPRDDGQFAYVAPQLKQAKRIAWKYLKKYAKHATKRVNESELSIELVNGSTIFVMGADDPDSIRGMYLDGVILDEFAQIKPSVWGEVIRPLLSDRRGWAVFLGTPKGKGNLLYQFRQKAAAAPDRFFLMELKASKSGLIGPKELAELKADLDDAEYKQEYECSFDAALKGSYYGSHITQIDSDHRIGKFPYVDGETVHLSFDIGRNDATAIWFYQFYKGEVRFFDYWEESGWDAEQVVEMLMLKPYNYEQWWLPHDAKHRTFATRKSVIDTFRDYNAPARKAPDPDAGNRVFHRVDAVRKFLRTYPVYFDKVKCERGIEALKNYSRTWNAKAGQFDDTPKHDRWSHGADSFGIAVCSIQPEDLKRSVEREIDRVRRGEATLTSPSSVINIGWTLKDAVDQHRRQLAAERARGRTRI